MSASDEYRVVDTGEVWSPLALMGWMEFNAERHGVSAQRVSLTSIKGDTPRMDVVLYHDSRDRVVLPGGNIYLPGRVVVAPRQSQARINHQVSLVSSWLADLIRSHGIGRSVSFSPEITDGRHFQWLNFELRPRYTYHLDLPLVGSSLARTVKRKIVSAGAAGYECVRSSDFEAVVRCLRGSESRQGFNYGLDLATLRRAEALLGPESMRTYVCYAETGAPASARVVLHHPGTIAIDWVAGTADSDRRSGATQALVDFALGDLSMAQAAGFDYGGANLPTVAAAKSDWGGVLTPYLSVRQPGVKSIAHSVLAAFESVRAR